MKIKITLNCTEDIDLGDLTDRINAIVNNNPEIKDIYLEWKE